MSHKHRQNQVSAGVQEDLIRQAGPEEVGKVVELHARKRRICSCGCPLCTVSTALNLEAAGSISS